MSHDKRSEHASNRLRRVIGVGIGAIVAIGGIVAVPSAATAGDCSDKPWMDTSKSSSQRADALLDASSRYQMYRWLNVAAVERAQQTDFAGVIYPAQLECTPVVFHTDGADGVRREPGTTAFPAPIAMAATFNLDLVYDKSVAQAVETFETGHNVILGPGLASGRTPLSGRNSEYFGEDSLLSGLLGAATSRGFEENDENIAVLANAKHYVANEQELDRNTSSSNIDERTFRQVYALPYEIALAEGDPESVMCSYNLVNGVYACENEEILDGTLRESIGWDGYVMSDFRAVHSTGPAIAAGLDQELNDPTYFTPDLIDAAIDAGEITLDDVETAAFRVVRSYIEEGLFDTPMPTSPNPDSSTAEHKAIARALAEQGTVLLKNDGLLPLSEDQPGQIAVFGPTASATATNGVSANSVCSMFNRRSNTLLCEDLVAPDSAIAARGGEYGAVVAFDAGDDVAAAAASAAAADVAIVFGYKMMGEFVDPEDLSLDGNGDALIAAVAAANPNTVVVLQAGSAVEMPWIDEVSAVLHAWYPGEQMGPAIASLLWGDVNPSGKLPMTLPVSESDTPTGGVDERYPGIFADGSVERPAGSDEIRQVNYTEGLEVGYKWYDAQDIDPLFEFGHGLSYTTFEYSKLKVKTTTDPKTGQVESTVSFFVQNTGAVAGSEVPQVYLTLPAAAGEPGKRLVAFDRIALDPGKKQKVTVVIDSSASNQPFAIWDVEDDEWSIVEGDFTVSVGSSSRDLPLIGTITVD
ncbi:beta-glucosidase [Microbacterium hominis]|uniref:Glycoside hydrolase family 3 C-terminal domain-containing protein n=1 Tax=Microbacterium hominis TaxID=162426 RepID=A0A7D4TGY6_9MICO|nr:glycoside hydrolase family 3 C-terminal domain-containing protein [Microbacterium hominis]QKJ20520.1 glycoside hydrolase family 3 C-terminal domain-containing protein [Microbacterium hominis]